ncbi:putative ADAMTS-like protein 5-like [Penaeus vannamei]|uniref:Putative ADAMTS-like protein 5-like n=1 Tax=Penaeus vannamei TaxID=6689 RepID=A0A423TTS1_PENVA|nr:putative ADAMTS-like protein 5-like [Penaeus vannamei]
MPHQVMWGRSAYQNQNLHHDLPKCAGDSVEYSVCGVKACPPGMVSAVSFRAAQCRHYNNRRVFGRVVNNWVPYTQGGINPCALVCEGEGEGIVYTFGKVTDGTHCRTDQAQDGLCVNGRCLRLSCDGRLGGTAREDMCRICGGHNETCTRHVGVFHTDLPAADQPSSLTRAGDRSARNYGYYEVSYIPKGATNVRVRDTSPNFLALKAGSKFLLNGDWLIDWPGEVDAGGTLFTYARNEDESESLSALGPTSEDLTLMVLLREHNPGIYYEYWTPNSRRRGPSRRRPLPSVATSSTRPRPHPLRHPRRLPNHHDTTTPTPRPAVLTSVNVTRIRKPPLRTPLRRPRPRPRPPFRRRPPFAHRRPPPPEPRGQRHVQTQEARQAVQEALEREAQGGGGQGRERQTEEEEEAARSPCLLRPLREAAARQADVLHSDFVSRVEVINSEPVGGERRYEVLVHQSYKNTVPLLHKEFLWVDNNCLCPKMRHGRSYLVMGSTEVTRGREVRLVLRNGSYVRRYTPRNLARILRVRHNEMRFCRPWRRDLRFLRPEDKALNATAANATAGDASASAASTAGSSAVLLVGT